MFSAVIVLVFGHQIAKRRKKKIAVVYMKWIKKLIKGKLQKSKMERDSE